MKCCYSADSHDTQTAFLLIWVMMKNKSKLNKDLNYDRHKPVYCTLGRDIELSFLLNEEHPMALKRRQFTRELKLLVIQEVDSDKSIIQLAREHQVIPR